MVASQLWCESFSYFEAIRRVTVYGVVMLDGSVNGRSGLHSIPSGVSHGQCVLNRAWVIQGAAFAPMTAGAGQRVVRLGTGVTAVG